MTAAPPTFERRVVAGVPLLLARPADAAAPLPLVLWHHGFGADAEAHRAELARVASLGMLAAGADAAGHGARRWPDWDDRLAAARRDGAVFDLMLGAAVATAAETPALAHALGAEGLADAARVSIVGISLGAFAAYRAAAAFRSFRAAVALLGDPRDVPPAAFDEVALLSIAAERDASVPPDGARRFHAALDARPERRAPHRYVELAGAEHLMTGAQWARAMDETTAWLAHHAR